MKWKKFKPSNSSVQLSDWETHKRSLLHIRCANQILGHYEQEIRRSQMNHRNESYSLHRRRLFRLLFWRFLLAFQSGTFSIVWLLYFCFEWTHRLRLHSGVFQLRPLLLKYQAPERSECTRMYFFVMAFLIRLLCNRSLSIVWLSLLKLWSRFRPGRWHVWMTALFLTGVSYANVRSASAFKFLLTYEDLYSKANWVRGLFSGRISNSKRQPRLFSIAKRL